MKKYLKLTVFAAIAAALTINTSCTNDEAIDVGQAIHEPMVLGIGMHNPLAVTRTTGTSVAWGGTITDAWVNDAVVYVWTLDAGQTAGNESVKDYKTSASATGTSEGTSGSDINQDGTSDGTMNTTRLIQNTSGASNTFYWGSTTETKTIRAWSYGTTNTMTSTEYQHYEKASGTDKGSFSVMTDQTINNDEFLYAYGDVPYTGRANVLDATPTPGTPTYLVFRHQLARINLKIKSKKQFTASDGCTLGRVVYNTPGDATSGENPIYKVPVTNTFLAPSTKNTGDVAWDAFTATNVATGKGVITPREQGFGSDESEYKVINYSAVVLPGDYNGYELFVINYDGATYVYKPNAAHNITLGNQYAYTITIGDQGLEVSATIKPWSTGTPVSDNAVLQ